MNVCFHVAHAAMKPVNAGLAYRSRDLALAVLEYLTNWPAACAQSPRRFQSWAKSAESSLATHQKQILPHRP